MCGIYGQIADLPRRILIENAQRAVQSLAHRGPDGEGVIAGEGYCLAHRRLAVFDTSDLGAQPMTGWGRTVVFNGAIYNFEELREELADYGYQFRSRTDTEVILAAYDRWGPDCFSRFNGMWALAMINPVTGEIVLSRDRFGIKPLYYSVTGGLTFASEPKLVANTVGKTPEIDRRVAAEFLAFGWQDHRPEAIYSGVLQLAPGHYATATLKQPARLQITKYYDLTSVPDRPSAGTSRSDAIARLRELLIDSVRLRSRSDVGSSVTLSGGIDSSSIAGIIAHSLQLRPTTFSALFPGDAVDESPYVEAVCRQHDLPNVALKPKYGEVISDFLAAQNAQDQPIASLAVVVHYQLMRIIQASGERVLLNGQGADETGAGYDKFYLPYLREALHSRPLSGLGMVAHYLARQPLDPGKTFSRLTRIASPQAARDRAITGEWFAHGATQPFVRSGDADVRATSINLLREVGLPVLLRHEDRNTMAFGLESRAPFMDHRVVEHLLAMPAEWKIHRAIRKYAIRRACQDVLPAKVLHRHKKLGFPTPSARWMEQDPGRYLEEIATGCRLGFFTPELKLRCDRILRKRLRHQYDLVFRCFSWVTFMRAYTDSSASQSSFS